jgi:hypothetical protein
MNEWTEKQVVYIAKRVLADETASDTRKEWARAVLNCDSQEVIKELFSRTVAESQKVQS